MDKQGYVIKINKNLKGRKICHIIALIVFSIQFFLNLLINCANLISNKIEINRGWGTLSVVLKRGSLLVVILLSIFDGLSKKKFILEEKDFNQIPKKEMNYALISLIIFSPYFIALLAVLYGNYGSYGLAILPTIIGHIFYIIAYVNMKKYNKLFIVDKLEEKTKIKETAQAQKLLAKVGKIFFINYYNQLKRYNTIDIVDVIQENYSEDNKKCRIANAKKIFSMNLQVAALNIILKDKDGVASQEILGVAKSILEKETTEQLILAEMKRKEKEAERKRKEIIPDCSICRYNIDEKSCEIWIKKPVETCAEFKIKKDKK